MVNHNLVEEVFFRTLGSQIRSPENDMAMWWILNLADGSNDLIDIASESGLSWKTISFVGQKLLEGGLLKNID